MVDLEYSLDNVTEIIKKCVYSEHTEDGLLHDVKTIIPVYHNEYGIEEPCIWITQHPSFSKEDNKRNISKTMTLITPFQFTCVEWDKDPEIAELKGQNLATRVAICVQRNYLKIQKELGCSRTIRHIDFNSYLPNGEVPIEGRSEKVPCTAIILDVVHDVNWNNCIKKNGD